MSAYIDQGCRALAIYLVVYLLMECSEWWFRTRKFIPTKYKVALAASLVGFLASFGLLR